MLLAKVLMPWGFWDITVKHHFVRKKHCKRTEQSAVSTGPLSWGMGERKPESHCGRNIKAYLFYPRHHLEKTLFSEIPGINPFLAICSKNSNFLIRSK